jgi:MFS transporter, FSR family, fosmidomycin resistance protein
MTAETPTIPLRSAHAAELRVIGSVSAAHFLSHFYFLLLPPVFMAVRGEYGVNYTELGFAITVFNIVSAIFQTPAGFLADRVGPFVVLVVGLALEAIAFALVGAVHSYWFLVFMFGVAGLANTVFHPADYALLSHHIPKERVGRAFSFHTFAGILGGAVAPASVLLLEKFIGWRGAFIAAAIAGIIVTLVLVMLRSDFTQGPHITTRAKADAGETTNNWDLLTSGPILRSFAFFTVLAVSAIGIQNYSIAALHDLFGTPPGIANAALTSNLLLSAIGVAVGGVIVGRIGNHGLFAAFGITVSGISLLVIAFADFGTATLLLVMGVSGFASGVIMPSRDMLVREVTPPGSFGTVFGFVTTGFNVAGVLFPVVFGALMDYGQPRAVFIVSAVCCFLAIATVVTIHKRVPVAR